MPYVKNHGKDFTRKRKLSFGKIMNFLVCMGGQSIGAELLISHNFDADTATTSAFIQQRSKILPGAFEHVLHEFVQPACTKVVKYKGYRLLAIDGSDLNIPTNPSDTPTYYKANLAGRGHNLLHLNALYDLQNRLYTDAVVMPSREMGENVALIEMINRSPIDGNVIIVADRNYESYNNIAHIQRKGWNYVIRVKDINSWGGMLSGLTSRLPTEGEFDVNISFALTKKQTNYVKANPHIYKILQKAAPFDFLDMHENLFFDTNSNSKRCKGYFLAPAFGC